MRTLITATLLFGCCAIGCYSEFEPRKETTPRKVVAKPSTDTAASEGKKKTKKTKKPKQTYRQAWEVICHAEQRAGIDPALDRQERGSLVAGWLVEHLKNKEARYWLIRFGDTKEEPERRTMLRAEAKKVGITRCPLEALLFAAPDAGVTK